MSQASNQRVGQYNFLRKLGAGRIAEVYLGRIDGAEGFQKPVAIKKIFQQLASDPDFVQSLIAEAKIGGQLHHRNIVEVYDFIRYEDEYCIIMEYVEGVDLSRILRAARQYRIRIPPAAALYIVSQLCDGLDYAHSARGFNGEPLKIIHRDLKPSNVLLSTKGGVKISDFGVARVVEQALDKMGTLGSNQTSIQYQSPELATNSPNLTPASDIFAVGAIFYELLTLEPLFPAQKAQESLAGLKEEDLARRLAIARRALPGSDKILEAALKPDPNKRYRSASLMGEDIRRLLAYLRVDDPRERLISFFWRLVRFIREKSKGEPSPLDAGGSEEHGEQEQWGQMSTQVAPNPLNQDGEMDGGASAADYGAAAVAEAMSQGSDEAEALGHEDFLEDVPVDGDAPTYDDAFEGMHAEGEGQEDPWGGLNTGIVPAAAEGGAAAGGMGDEEAPYDAAYNNDNADVTRIRPPTHVDIQTKAQLGADDGYDEGGQFDGDYDGGAQGGYDGEEDYGQEAGGYGDEAGGYGAQDGGFGDEADGYGAQDGGFGDEAGGYGDDYTQEGGYDQGPDAYGDDGYGEYDPDATRLPPRAAAPTSATTDLGETAAPSSMTTTGEWEQPSNSDWDNSTKPVPGEYESGAGHDENTAGFVPPPPDLGAEETPKSSNKMVKVAVAAIVLLAAGGALVFGLNMMGKKEEPQRPRITKSTPATQPASGSQGGQLATTGGNGGADPSSAAGAVVEETPKPVASLPSSTTQKSGGTTKSTGSSTTKSTGSKSGGSGSSTKSKPSTASKKPAATPKPYRSSTKSTPKATPKPYKPAPTPKPYKPAPTPKPYKPAPTAKPYKATPIPTPYPTPVPTAVPTPVPTPIPTPVPTAVPEKPEPVAAIPPVEVGPPRPVAEVLAELYADETALANLAKSGKLSPEQLSALSSVGRDSEEQFTSSRSYLALHHKATRNTSAYGKALDELMSIPTNTYNPTLRLEQAEYYLQGRRYQEAIDAAEVAQRYRQKFPRGEPYYIRLARTYEVLAKAHEGRFTGNENPDDLGQAIQFWERYLTHVSRKQDAKRMKLAEDNIGKLKGIQERLR